MNPTNPSVSPLGQLLQCVLTTEQIRAVDQAAVHRFGMHSLVLMENAGLQCVRWIAAKFAQPTKTVVLCGPGNNGGDGLVITRHLRTLGWDCHAYILGPESKFSHDTLANANILRASGGTGLTIIDADKAELVRPAMMSAGLIVDSMLGTGVRDNPRPPLADWINWANTSQAFRLAIDIPTGIRADAGQAGTPFFQANATLTFVARKPSMLGPNVERLYGTLDVLPIGIPEQLIVELLHLNVGPT